MRRAAAVLGGVFTLLAWAHPSLGAPPPGAATQNTPAPASAPNATPAGSIADPNRPTRPSAFVGRAGMPLSGRAPAGALQDIGPDDFCVTCGALRPQADGRSLVDSPKMRAVVDHMTGQTVDLHFTYLGPTRRLMALSSGQSRVQLGLKLFAHDACNLVYVMWRLYPQPGIVVSTKRNAGMQLSSGCGNHGYNNVRALQQAPTPPVAVGVPHRLRIARDGDALSVFADEVLAWKGRLIATQADDLEGLTGIRSDNGRFIVKLQLSDTGPGNWRGAKPACTTAPSQEE